MTVQKGTFGAFQDQAEDFELLDLFHTSETWLSLSCTVLGGAGRKEGRKGEEGKERKERESLVIHRSVLQGISVRKKPQVKQIPNN